MTTSESKGRFFYKTNRFYNESIRIANLNALAATLSLRATFATGGRIGGSEKKEVLQALLKSQIPGNTTAELSPFSSSLNSIIALIAQQYSQIQNFTYSLFWGRGVR